MSVPRLGQMRKKRSVVNVIMAGAIVFILVTFLSRKALPGKWTHGSTTLESLSRLNIMVPSQDTKKAFEDMHIKERLEFVRQRCLESKAWFDAPGEVQTQQTFKVDDRHLLMVCDLHKVASHQLAGILQSINNETGDLFGYRHKVVRRVSAEEANTSPHAKVMFVREPLERLLSAYIGDRAIRHVENKKVSLETFLKDVLATPIEDLNMHPQRFHDICQPCKVQYQFIGTLATFPEDIEQIFNRSDFKRTDKKNSSQRVAVDYLQDHFRNVNPSVIHEVWKKFKIDYSIFGYPYPKHLLNETSPSRQR